MTKEIRIAKIQTDGPAVAVFHLAFGFRYSFDIGHSSFGFPPSFGIPSGLPLDRFDSRHEKKVTPRPQYQDHRSRGERQEERPRLFHNQSGDDRGNHAAQVADEVLYPGP